MKRILALDTSGDSCSVALSFEGQVTALSSHSPRQHSQQLLSMVDQLLAAAGTQLSNVDAIAFGRGPGSFTGIRICTAIVQGLAYAQEIPVIPVSTLRTMAEGARQQRIATAGQTVLVAVDARMDEVYWALFKVVDHADQVVEIITEDAISSPDFLVSSQLVREVAGDSLVIVGSGLNYAEIAELPCCSQMAEFQPNAADMIALVQSGTEYRHAIEARLAQPVYLRDSVAWKKRQKIRN